MASITSRLLLTLILAFMAPLAQAAPLDKFLDFNDNAVPLGWTLQAGSLDRNSNFGVANGRLFAAQIDSSGVLASPYAPSNGVTALDFDWDGSVFQTVFGNNQGIDVVGLNNRIVITRTESASFNYGIGMRVYLGEDATPVFHKLSLPEGDYHFSARFTDGQVQYSGSLNGTQMFNYSLGLSNFALADLRAIHLIVYETVGADSWIDNVHIREEVSAIPEASISSMLLAGLLLLASIGARRSSSVKSKSAAYLR